MTSATEKLTAREFVWVHRIRQRIAFERIILTVGNPNEKLRAKQFLEAIEQANPELLEDIEQYTPEALDNNDHDTPELFEESEYSKATGRKTALKLPKDILWEERVIRRAASEYRDLFHPCESIFDNAMKGLEYLYNLHPELFTKAKAQAIEQRDQILNFDIYCKCGCANPDNSAPADSFKATNQGRFQRVSERISFAGQALGDSDVNNQSRWQFFLRRVSEVAPEMLQD